MAKQVDELLLIDEEMRPFVKAKVVAYGDIEITEEHWDIDGLLKAQLAKLYEYLDGEELRASISAIVRYDTCDTLVDRLCEARIARPDACNQCMANQIIALIKER